MDNQKSQILTYIGCALLIIGTFLPLYTIFGVSISYIDTGDSIGDGIFIIIFSAIVLLCTYFKKYKPALILNACNLFLLIRLFVKIGDASLGFGSWGYGFYTMVIGGVAALVGILYLLKLNKVSFIPAQASVTPVSTAQTPIENKGTSKFCSYCGRLLDSNDKFCPNCGGKR